MTNKGLVFRFNLKGVSHKCDTPFAFINGGEGRI